MHISPGSRLGPYEIVAPIGAGGMGEVWRARDTRLERTVAIKLLPPEFAANDAYRARFEREAKTISQLNDPRICTIHDVGQHDGRGYLVMELIEGESLADRVARGPLPLDELLRYAIDIAHALERAHEAGIVHRDLKPGNVMITRHGAKLLDFGLAKVAGEGVRPSVSGETELKPITEQGTIVGTFQYMAPEQIEGEEADARTDIFAFGTLLYEMATGRKAFEGKTRTSLIAAIVERQPAPISSVRPLTPPALERLVSTCLAKKPEDRRQSAHDLRLDLEWLANNEPVIAHKRRMPSLVPWLIAAGLAAIAIFAWTSRRDPIGEERVVRSSILPPQGMQFAFFLDNGPPAISPDGTRIVFVASSPGERRSLWIRTLDSARPRELPGTDGASHPFWSPDSRHIAFWSEGELKRLDVNGGAPVRICATDDFIRGGSWSRDGTILLGMPTTGLLKVPASGGTAVAATKLDVNRGETTHRWPHFLPDGKHYLFLAAILDEGLLSVGSLESGEHRPLIQIGSSAFYHDGWLLYVRDQTLTAHRFDPEKLEVIGEPIAVEDAPIEYDSTTIRSIFSMAEDGTLIYQTGGGVRETVLTWFDRKGTRLRSASGPHRYGSLAVSPDGRYVVHSVVPRSDLWLIDTVRNVRTRLTFENGRDFSPTWSPDGSRIAFASRASGGQGYDIHVKDLRTGQRRPLLVDEESKVPNSWSADGDKIFFTRRSRATGGDDIEYYSFTDGKAHPVIAGPFNESSPMVSPDGRWLAYVSSETRPTQVYLSPFPATGVKWQVSPIAGTGPRWRGNELFFFGHGKVQSVTINLSDPPEISAPSPWVTLPFGITRRWDIHGDFIIAPVQAEDEAPQQPLTLVQNFGAHLRALRNR